MIHHITAICKDAQKTSDFYTQVLGLRLVKVTVNQDDVGTYHLYFGDKTGRPGTALTFFPWGDLPKGVVGKGMVGEVTFRIPKGSILYWHNRLRSFGLDVGLIERLGDRVVLFNDPDGLPLSLIEGEGKGNWEEGGVTLEMAIIDFHGATLLLDFKDETEELLTKYLKYRYTAQEENRYRYDSEGSTIDILVSPDSPEGEQGLGTVHHIAFRAKDEDEQLALRENIAKEGFHLTSPIDRYYFKSVYFREWGGILFELATDGPGFTVDENVEELGSKLVLPPRFEGMRSEIEKMLPKFDFGKKK